MKAKADITFTVDYHSALMIAGALEDRIASLIEDGRTSGTDNVSIIIMREIMKQVRNGISKAE